MTTRFVVITAVLVAISLSAFAADPFLGTWKLIKTTQLDHQIGATITFEEAGEARKEIRQDGRNPWSASMTPAEAECRQSSSPNWFTNIFIYSRNQNSSAGLAKKGGDVATLKRKVSSGGRILTETMDGVTPTGQKFHSVDIYEKQ
jgi:hypothetical protein